MYILQTQWSWGEMLWTALIGFVLVALMLLGLVFVMKLFSLAFTKRKSDGVIVSTKKPVTDQEAAAIAIALRMYTLDLHDNESTILTIQSIKRAYSPWSSKIHGLRQLPNRK